MRRRHYLVLLGASPALAGCLQAPQAGNQFGALGGQGDDGGTGTAQTTDGGSGDDIYGDENVERYRHELSDWFELADDNISLMVDGTERVAPDEFDVNGDDVFIVNMRMENRLDDRTSLDHDPFWLEKLGAEQAPATEISEQLEFGAAGESTQLDPLEYRRLKLAFRVPDDIEPAYLWVKGHYVCLV